MSSWAPSADGDLPTVYIGEGDPVRPRLESHSANKDFWTWLVFFVSKDDSINKAHVKYLEAPAWFSLRVRQNAANWTTRPLPHSRRYLKPRQQTWRVF